MSTDLSANDGESLRGGQTHEQKERAARRAHRLTVLLVPVIFGAVFLGLPPLAMFLHRRGAEPAIIEEPSTDGEMTVLERLNPFGETTERSPPVEVDVTDTLFAIRQVTVSAKVARISQAVRRSRVASAEWDRLRRSTRQDDVGRQIAGSTELVDRFLGLELLEVPRTTELEAFLRRDGTMVDIKAALQDTARDLDRLLEAANARYAFEKNRLQVLKQIRDDARIVQRMDDSLERILEQREDRLASTASEVARQRAAATRSELVAQLGHLEGRLKAAKAEVINLDRQLEHIRGGGRLVQAAGSSEPPLVASRSAYLRELPLIRATLTPFITPGYVQPETADKLVYGESKVPISYSALRKVGALERTERGIQTLFRIGGSKSASQHNDRPLGGFPRMNSLMELQKPEVRLRLEQSQRLLGTYGRLMIDDGMLSP